MSPHRNLSATPQRRSSVWFLRTAAAVAVVLASAYVRTDGGAWLGPRAAALAQHSVLLTLFGPGLILAGVAAALLAAPLKRQTLLRGGAALFAAIGLIVAGSRPSLLQPALSAPDWTRAVLLFVGGTCWGVGWGIVRATTGVRSSLAVFFLPFWLSGFVVAVLSGSIGGVATLIWLLVVATALGQFCWGAFPFCRSRPVPPPRASSLSA